MAPSCFVISPFGEPFDSYLAQVYHPGIVNAGLEPVRADSIFTPGVFMQDVYKGISSARVALAELTGCNANVFYELGLAHALGIPVVLLAQRTEDVPSDLRAVRFLRYELAQPDWGTKLVQEITVALKAALDAPVSLPFASPDRRTFLEVFAGLSGTQKQIFDFLYGQPSEVALADLVKHFHRDETEMYYRLETLKLQGLLESPLRSSNYRLSEAARSQLARLRA